MCRFALLLLLWAGESGWAMQRFPCGVLVQTSLRSGTGVSGSQVIFPKDGTAQNQLKAWARWYEFFSFDAEIQWQADGEIKNIKGRPAIVSQLQIRTTTQPSGVHVQQSFVAEVLQVTQGSEKTYISLSHVQKIGFAYPIHPVSVIYDSRHPNTTGLTYYRLMEEWFIPKHCLLSDTKNLPESKQLEAQRFVYSYNGVLFKGVIYIDKTSETDPNRRQIKAIVFDTEADRQRFEDFIGTGLYQRHFRD